MISRRLIHAQLVSLIIFPLLYAHFNTATKLDYVALDGTFQSYNSAARMRAGEYPYRDFACYLGLGPTYLDWIAGLSGPKYADWNRGRIVIRSYLYFLAVITVARLSGISTSASLALPPILFCVDAYYAKAPAFLHAWLVDLRSFGINDHSELSVRSFAPCLYALMIAGAAMLDRNGDGVRRPIWRGIAAGICLAWSNDYGLPTLIAAVLGYVLFAPSPPPNAVKLVRDVVLMVVVAVATGLIVVLLGCGFDALAWYDYNFVQVAPNQKWFYFANGQYFSDGASLRITDLPLLRCALPILLVLWTRRLTRFSDRRPDFELATTIVSAAFGAGLLSTLGGYAASRYLMPFVVFGSIVFVGTLITTWKLRRPVDSVSQSKGWATRALGLLGLGLTWALIAAQVRLAEMADDQCMVSSQELGGRLTPKFDRTIAVGRELRRRCDAEQIPPDRRLSSTYTSGMDIVVGAKQSSQFDYLLHAVSPKLMGEYVDHFLAARPLFATTLRHDPADPERRNWEGWQRNTAWPFFSELLRNYEPVSRTHAHIVWERRNEPRVVPEGVVRWAVHEASERRIQYRMILDAPDDELMICEVTVKHRLTWRVSPWKLGCFAKLAVVIAPDGPDLESCFAFSPTTDTSSFSVILTPNIATPLEFLALPPDAATIEVEILSAAPVAPARLLFGKPLKLICPSPCSDERFANGIARDGRTAFRVTEPDDVADLRPGDRVAFAGSGTREVIGVANGVVTTDGPQLDSEADGFPHLIQRE